jgi:glycine dehydrogenase subunit 2
MTKVTDFASDADRFMHYKEIDTGYRAVRWHEKTLYDQSRAGTVNDILPPVEAALADETAAVLDELPEEARRAVPPAMPELTEPEILRHYIRCSQMTLAPAR